MEEKALPEILSQMISDSKENKQNLDDDNSDEQDNILVEGLKALAGRSGGTLKTAVDDFLKGEGELHESTRTALAIDKETAKDKIIDLLTTRFNLSPTLAGIIAPMLLKLLPFSEKKKRKTTRKPKKKTTSSKRKTSTTKKKKTSTTKKKTSTAKKPKKKTTTSAKKKTSTTKKKKPAASSTKKKTSTSKKPKKKKPAS